MAHNEEIPCFTPHKRADYNSPLKKISSRKKKANSEKWKRNKETMSMFQKVVCNIKREASEGQICIRARLQTLYI